MDENQILRAWKEASSSVAKPCAASRWFKKHYPEAYEKLVQLTQKLDRYEIAGSKYYHVRVAERIYCLEHGLDDRPFCQTCGKERVCGFFLYPQPGYSKWCSPKCQASDRSCLEKSKATRKARYGNENYVGNEKSRATREARYGGFHPASFGEKVKQTKLLRFGDPGFVNSDKAKATKLKRYGSAGWHNAEKAAQTKLERYGDPFYSNREKFKQTMAAKPAEEKEAANEKRKQTCQKRYGVDFPQQLADVVAKREQTCMARYGVATPFLLPSADEASARAVKARAWDSHVSCHELYQPLFSREDYLANRDSKKIWPWKCKKCGKVFEAPWNSTRLRCVDCFPLALTGQSAMERDLAARLREMAGCEMVSRDRSLLSASRQEVDMWFPAKKIAVEFDGLYWHSVQTGGLHAAKTYHLGKTEGCLARGVQLFHVFEDEWVDRKEAVCSELGRALGWKDLKKLRAEDLAVGSLDQAAAGAFFSENCVGGFKPASFWTGLFQKRSYFLAAAAGFKLRGNKLYVVQTAQANGYRVVGTIQRLTGAAIEASAAERAIVHADRRWPTQEAAFLEAGFEATSSTRPAAWEVVESKRVRKLSPGKAAAAGLAVFDCGTVELTLGSTRS